MLVVENRGEGDVTIGVRVARWLRGEEDDTSMPGIK
jgi:hypothetical protein